MKSTIFFAFALISGLSASPLPEVDVNAIEARASSIRVTSQYIVSAVLFFRPLYTDSIDPELP